MDEQTILRMAKLIARRNEISAELDRLAGTFQPKSAVENQCTEVTAKGQQCRHRATSPDGQCGVHQRISRRKAEFGLSASDVVVPMQPRLKVARL